MLKTLEDVSKILRINANEIPGLSEDKNVLVAWTNDLIRKKGIRWVKKNRVRLLNRWEMIYGTRTKADS